MVRFAPVVSVPASLNRIRGRANSRGILFPLPVETDGNRSGGYTKMADGRLTVIIVPGAGSALRKFKISARFLPFALISLAVLALVCLGTVIQYARHMQTVELENAQLKANLKQSQVLTEKLTRKITVLSQLSARLKAMAGFPMAAMKRHASKLGMGGVTVGGNENPPDPQTLVWLQRRADIIERSLTQLHNYYRDQNAIPSIVPTQGFISSTFGARRNPFTGLPDFHEGMDISGDIGTPVLAAADGLVAFAGEKGNSGRVVEIEHSYDFSSFYGHLHKTLVQPGQKVKRGQIIGLMGNSGNSTGTHLHYEVHVHGQPVNPRPYLLNLAG